MKITYKLSLPDQTEYKDFPSLVMDDIVPLIEDFYKDYDATIKEATYDSSRTINQGNTYISFAIESTGFYPKLIIEIIPNEKVQFGNIFVEPSRRVYRVSVSMYGVSTGLVEEVCKEFSIEHGFIIDTGTPTEDTPANKMKQLLVETKDRVKNWKGYFAASEIFLF